MKDEPITTGACSVCGRAVSGGFPCHGGYKIEPEKAKAATDDGLALQHRNVAGGNGDSIAQPPAADDIDGRGE